MDLKFYRFLLVRKIKVTNFTKGLIVHDTVSQYVLFVTKNGMGAKLIYSKQVAD